MHPSKNYLHSHSHGNSRRSNTSNGPKGKARRPPKQRGTEARSASTKQKASRERYASMLPPPLKSPRAYGEEGDEADEYPNNGANGTPDFDPSGLSSWEQFLGTNAGPESTISARKKESKWRNDQDELNQKPPSMAKLPSIQDLFPPDLSVSVKHNTEIEPQPDDTLRARQRQARQRQSNNDTAASSGTDNTLQQSPKAKTNLQEAGQSRQSLKPLAQQKQKQQQPPLEGVLPVSDLFYRSSQAMDAVDDRMEGDDEELPFSAEQTDQLAVNHNKVKVRKNQALESIVAKTKKMNTNNPSKKDSKSRPKPNRRKMVRRGMEMLVGGVPINADPPQRSIELMHNPSDQKWYTAISVNSRDFGPFFSDTCQHHLSQTELALFCEYFVHYTMKWDVCPKELRQIVQEYYKGPETTSAVSNASLHQSSSLSLTASVAAPSKFKLPSANCSPTLRRKKAKLQQIMDDTEKMKSKIMDTKDIAENNNCDETKTQKLKETLESMKTIVKQLTEGTKSLDIDVSDLDDDDDVSAVSSHAPRGFGKPVKQKSRRRPGKDREAKKLKEALIKMKEAVKDMEADIDNEKISGGNLASVVDLCAEGTGKGGEAWQQNESWHSSIELELEVIQGHLEVVFDLSFSRDELEKMGEEDGRRGTILKEVFLKGLRSCLQKELPNPEIMLMDTDTPETMIMDDVTLEELRMAESDEGTTEIRIIYALTVAPVFVDGEKAKQKLSKICDKVVDSGDLSLAMATVVKEEARWPEEFRDRVYEDILFEDDDEDKTVWEDEGNENEGKTDNDAKDSILPEPQKATETNVASSRRGGETGPDNRFIQAGPDGVFWDYSEANAVNAPFEGKLGHKLLAAVENRSKEHPPKVIAVGDVHGCIDELQDLLRQCEYNPGDMIVFLGDLVSKGPDSISVVQMSKEIGAIGVRGNHDFEVIRWHQAIKSGVDPPVVGSEHYHVASCLSKADVKWLYSLPWYITSKQLGALFVHAGFVSGIRLVKQNPRLMMNMRSILPDGTVTSKFFNNWPWARLWDGPQTVFFGHDADRGLQQYEHAIGLDTGCVYGGRLTACILPEKRLVSVSARREYFKYRRKHYD